jgi:flagellar biosynthesis/type III secretory pathway M-ring protein FliF/YscJ
MPNMPNMPMWNNVWNSWAWQMALWMVGATLLWIILIVVVAWLIARWETRALRQVNASALQLERAQDAHGDVETELADMSPYPSRATPVVEM